MNKNSRIIPFLCLLSVSLLAGCRQDKDIGIHVKDSKDVDAVIQSEDNEKGDYSNNLSIGDIKIANAELDISCHDPQIIYADNDYYMTGSHQVIAKSSDFTSWDYVANGNRMFDNIFNGSMPAFEYVGKNEQGGYSVWASNIFYNETMGKYIMYFCTSSTYIKSSLCMAISDTPGGPYTFEKAFLHSGFGESEIDNTNLREIIGEDADVSKYLLYGGYNNKDWPNCIDPAVFVDKDGRQWMVYGSWSGGIFMLELDAETGLPIHPEKDVEAEVNYVDRYFGYHLIGGDHHAIEGPYITYDEGTGYYYLFVSYGELQRDGGYQIRQYRSESPTGPYVDAAGKTVGKEDDFFNYGIKMAGNYVFPSLETAYMAPGGQSVFEGEDGNIYITYHQRFDNGSEYHEPRVHRMYMNSEGWYVMAPFETGTEVDESKSFDVEDVAGEYYVVEHGLDVSDRIREAISCNFENGVMTGFEEEGHYEVAKDSNQITIWLGEEEYHGVIIDMVDEAGNNVRCISVSGLKNHTIWAVQYRK